MHARHNKLCYTNKYTKHLHNLCRNRSHNKLRIKPLKLSTTHRYLCIHLPWRKTSLLPIDWKQLNHGKKVKISQLSQDVVIYATIFGIRQCQLCTLKLASQRLERHQVSFKTLEWSAALNSFSLYAFLKSLRMYAEGII